MRQQMPTPAEKARALQIAEQLAALLNELDSIEPGSVRANAGRISGCTVEIRQSLSEGWSARTV